MPLDQGIELREADEVKPVLDNDDRGELSGRIAPELVSVPDVEAERLAVQRREVDNAVDHARRARNLAPGGKPPADVARRGIEGVEGAVVGADEHVAAPDGRRAVDEVSGAVRPAQLSARGSESGDVVRPVADEDEVAGEKRRALAWADRALPANPAGLRVEADHLAVGAVCGVAGRLVEERDEDKVPADRR